MTVFGQGERALPPKYWKEALMHIYTIWSGSKLGEVVDEVYDAQRRLH